MSRTYRKRRETFNEYYRDWIDGIENDLALEWQVKYITKEKYRYNTRTVKHYDFGLPKSFRNMINRQRRAKDKQEIWKAINLHDYPEQCSKWNCKDANHWEYW